MIARCISAGWAIEPGLVIEAGTPWGAEVPGRPPSNVLAPGGLTIRPPPDPGDDPRSELPDPGGWRISTSTVGAWA